MQPGRGPRNSGRRDEVPPPDGPDGPDLTDLGERPLPRTFEQSPERVDRPGWARRLSTPAVVVVAVTVIALGVTGGALLISGPGSSPEPSASAGASQVAAASPSSSPEACAPTLPGQPAPVVALARSGEFDQRRPVALTVADPADAGFEPPVDRTVEVPPGAAMRLQLNDARCIDGVRLDLHGVGLPGDSALAISMSAPLSDGRSYAFAAPPSGDWVLRVALKVRAEGDVAGDWAIYFFRLNSGFVPYEAPLPSGSDGGTAEPIETPVVPCGPPPTAWPLAVDLVTDDGAGVAGVPFLDVPLDWNDDIVRTTFPSSLASASPIDLGLDEAITLRIAGAACAVRWQLEAGPIPAAGEPFVASWWWAGQTDNDAGDPAVISQNFIAARVASVGEFALRLTIDIADIGAEALFWRIRVPGPELPVARVTGPDGTTVAMSRGCGAAYELESQTYASDACATIWPLLDDGPVLSVPAGSVVRIDASGTTVVRWWAQYTDRATVVEGRGLLDGNGELLDRVVHLADGGSDLGFASFELPAPPPDASAPDPSAGTAFGWVVEVNLSVRIPGGVAHVPYFVRVRVTP